MDSALSGKKQHSNMKTFAGVETALIALEKQLVGSTVPPRRCARWWIDRCPPLLHSDAHKGTNGRILIIGGSSEFTGAPFLAAMAAVRVGADYATVVCPPAVAATIRGYSPDIVVRGLLKCPNAISTEVRKEHEKKKTQRAADATASSSSTSPNQSNVVAAVGLVSAELGNLISSSHAIVVGPGLGSAMAAASSTQPYRLPQHSPVPPPAAAVEIVTSGDHGDQKNDVGDDHDDDDGDDGLSPVAGAGGGGDVVAAVLLRAMELGKPLVLDADGLRWAPCLTHLWSMRRRIRRPTNAAEGPAVSSGTDQPVVRGNGEGPTAVPGPATITQTDEDVGGDDESADRWPQGPIVLTPNAIEFRRLLGAVSLERSGSPLSAAKAQQRHLPIAADCDAAFAAEGGRLLSHWATSEPCLQMGTETNDSPCDLSAERRAEMRGAAFLSRSMLQATVVVKGERDVVLRCLPSCAATSAYEPPPPADLYLEQQDQCWSVVTVNQGSCRRSAGQGDVLAGVIAAHLAWTAPAFRPLERPFQTTASVVSHHEPPNELSDVGSVLFAAQACESMRAAQQRASAKRPRYLASDLFDYL